MKDQPNNAILTANEIFSRGAQIEERVQNLSDPRARIYRRDDGKHVLGNGSLVLDEPKDGDEDELEWYQEEVAELIESVEEASNSVWWMVDFFCHGWFHDEKFKTFVSKADPIKGLLRFAELSLKLEQFIYEFCEFGEVPHISQFDEHSLKDQTARIERILILARWLQTIGSKPESTYVTHRGSSYLEHIGIEPEDVWNRFRSGDYKSKPVSKDFNERISPRRRILPEYRTKPITKIRAGRLMGREGDRSSATNWISNCIKDGLYQVEMHSRQSFVFDIRDFPEGSHDQLRVSEGE